MQKDDITKENLKFIIEEMTSNLLSMAKDHSWNKISSQVSYVINKIKTGVTKDQTSCNLRQQRKRLLSLKDRLSLESLTKALRSEFENIYFCLLYTSPSPRAATLSRMPSSA